MHRLKVRGLILRSSPYGESNKMLTVLTSEYGRISVSAKGGKSHKRGAYMNNFCLCEFMLIKRGDMYSLDSASPLNDFLGISKSIEKLYAASTVTSFAAYICKENQPAEDMLRLTLNCLYALSELSEAPHKILLAFFLKSAEINGFCPQLDFCISCSESSELNWFSPSAGGILCSNCHGNEPYFPDSSIEIMKYILNSDFKDMLKFNADEGEINSCLTAVKDFIYEQFDYTIKTDI